MYKSRSIYVSDCICIKSICMFVCVCSCMYEKDILFIIESQQQNQSPKNCFEGAIRYLLPSSHFAFFEICISHISALSSRGGSICLVVSGLRSMSFALVGCFSCPTSFTQTHAHTHTYINTQQSYILMGLCHKCHEKANIAFVVFGRLFMDMDRGRGGGGDEKMNGRFGKKVNVFKR